MIMKSGILAVVIAVVFTLGIGGTMLFNIWNSTTSKTPARIADGAFAGEADPADIRGSYSLADIEKNFDVPVGALAEAFGIAADNPASFQVKGLEGTLSETENGEIGTDAVRWFVALYTGLPYEPEETTLLPHGAEAVLGDRLPPSARGRIAAAVPEPAPALPAAAESADEAPADGTDAPSVPAASDTEARVVMGRTTFAELSAWGLTGAEIERTLGMAAGIPAMSIRDFASQNGLDFAEIKSRLQALLDAKRDAPPVL